MLHSKTGLFRFGACQGGKSCIVSRKAKSGSLQRSLTKMSKEGKLYVGNLSFDTTKEDLRDAFEKYGKIDDVQIIMDRYTGKAKGFGFVTFENADDAKDAMKAMDDTDLDGRQIRVDKANPQRSDDKYRGSGDRYHSNDGYRDRYRGSGDRDRGSGDRDRGSGDRDRDYNRDRRDSGSSRRY